MTISQHNLTKGKDDMTWEELDTRFKTIWKRISKPETDADRDLIWAAFFAFVLGMIIG